MDRKVFSGRPLPSRSRGWAIASAIDHVSVVRNKVLDEQACHAAIDHRHVRSKIMYLYIVNCHLDHTEMRVLNSIFSSFIQYPHATRYTKSFGLPVSLVTVTERGCPKSRLVFLGAAGANAELGNGLPGPSFLDQVGRRIYYCVIHTL